MTEWASTNRAAAYGRDLLCGERVGLRVLRDGDVDTLVAWWNDPATAVLQNQTVRPQPHDSVAGMLREWSTNKDLTAAAFVVETHAERELVGHVALFAAVEPARAATLGVFLGPQHVGQGYGTDAVRTMLRYGFDEMGLHRVGLQVYAFNDRAVAVYGRLGFREEGRRREVLFHEGRYHDELLMGLLADEWRSAGTDA